MPVKNWCLYQIVTAIPGGSTCWTRTGHPCICLFRQERMPEPHDVLFSGTGVGTPIVQIPIRTSGQLLLTGIILWVVLPSIDLLDPNINSQGSLAARYTCIFYDLSNGEFFNR